MGGPDWAGWGFNRSLLQTRLYTAAEANAASNSVLMVEPVFDDDPDWMLETNQLLQVQIDQLLASGIPALSYAAGLAELDVSLWQDFRNFDMNDPEYSKVNGWPRTYGDDDELRWLHSDIKNVAYVYTWKLFDKIVEEGELRLAFCHKGGGDI
jgi:hypothetical protein